jgi:hypothetical protein
MSIETQSPIPLGVYWVDVPRSEQVGFSEWLKAHVPTEIQIVRVNHYKRTPERQPFDWVLFEVTSPVLRWGPDVKIGFPSVAVRGRDTVADDLHESEDALDQAAKQAGFESKGRFLRDVGVGVTTGVVAGTILWLITRRK